MSSEGVDLVFDDEYRDIRDKMNEKYFESAADTCIFALSIGMKLNLRIPKKDWKGNPLSWSDLERVKNRYGGFSEFFEYLDMKDAKVPTTELMAEFVTGGLKFIDDNYLFDDGNLGTLVKYAPDLFSF